MARIGYPPWPNMRRGWSFLALLLPTAISAAANAQTLPSIDARTWRPSTDPMAGLVLEPVSTPGGGNWNVGALFSYTHHPLTLRDATTNNVAFRPVELAVGMDVVASLGIGPRVAVGLSVPTVLYQDGSTNLPPQVHGSGSAPSTAIGDVGVHGKVAIMDNAGGGFGLAALANVTLPTGDKASFLGDGSLTATARLLAEYTFVIASAQASLGYTARTETHDWPDKSVGGFTFGDTIPWHAGFSVKPGIFKLDSENRQRWDVSVHGWLPATPVGPFGAGEPGSAKQSPVLLNLSDRWALGHGRDVYVTFGADIGLSDAVGVPAFRAIAGLGWAPREHDMDHDGVPDDVDQCPDVPEDRDGFEDADGCPEIDDDDDGIIDREDACPRVKGVESTDPKRNGCPADDADGDGISDDVDACKTEKGPHSDDPAKNGCPAHDRDEDGVWDDLDKCPDQAEDKDGFEDADGCPDPDNDGDGIGDKSDACPNQAGEPSTDPAKNGCPNLDKDGDTYENDKDQCPNEAEVYNGVKDEDGCPDEGGKPLVVIDPKDPKLVVKLAAPIKLTGAGDAQEVDASSTMLLRALALELHRHRDWTLAVASKPTATTPEAQQASLARAFAVVHALAGLSHRDGVAETVGWDAVKNRPNDGSLGLMILVAPSQPVAKPTPPQPLPMSPPAQQP